MSIDDTYSLNKFTEIVYKMTDPELLEAAEGLMNDLAMINNMKQKIEMMEETLHAGKRAAFYFFTLNLDSDEIAMATQTVRGRKRVLAEKAAREDKKTEPENS